MKITEIIEKINLKDPKSAQLAVIESLGLNVKVGDTVAVLNDSTYPFDGQKGTVREINGGFAKVEFKNGAKVNLQASLLISV